MKLSAIRFPSFPLRQSADAIRRALGGRSRTLLLAATGVSGVLMAATTVYGLRASADSLYYRTHIDRMSSLNERVARDVPNVNTGQLTAFISLYSSLVQYRDALSSLQSGEGLTPPMGGDAVSPMERIDRELGKAMEVNDALMEAGEGVVAVRASINRLSQTSADIVEDIDRVIAYQVQRNIGGIAAGQLVGIASLKSSLQKINQAVNYIAEAQAVRDGMMAELASDINTVRETLHALHGSAEAKQNIPAIADKNVVARLNVVTEKLIPYIYEIEERIPTLAKMVTVKSASITLPALVDRVGYETDILRGVADGLVVKSNTLYAVAVFAGLITALLASLLAVRMIAANRRTAEAAIAANDAMQESIAVLLEDIQQISSGNLSARAKVSENDVTGVIADAFNLTASSLAKVVRDIKDSSGMVIDASKESLALSESAGQIAVQQKSEVQETVRGIGTIIQSIGEVSVITRDAAAVADSSLQSAATGRDSVARTIEAIGDMREQVREAARRVERAAAVSREITQITDTISDITERTGILALNANVQAAAAGEAGLGFAAVAEEVQNLASRSEESLRRVTALVDSMQADTREAVSVMSRMLSSADRGAEVAEQAGQALDGIEQVARDLSGLVLRINTLLADQTTSAGSIGDRMNSLLDLTGQSVDKLNETAADIRKIFGMTEALDRSVAGFQV